MKQNSYAFQIRSLRAAEKQRSIDLTSQAMLVFNLRVETLTEDIQDPALLEQAINKAAMQYKAFMGRDVLANG